MSAHDEPLGGLNALSPSDDDAHRVSYEFSCPDFPDELEVHSFDAVEELNRPYVVRVRVEAHSEPTDLGELLGRDVIVRLHRRDHVRSFSGIVGRVRLEALGQTGPIATVEIAPALWALRFTEDSRIFQEKTALEIVETILNDGLGKYGRRFDTTSLNRERYLARDYCLQYRESSLDFVHRLLEEEGIGYCFRQADDDPETLVLFDDNADLSRVRTMNQGPVPFDPAIRAWAGSEPISQFAMATALASSQLTVREHDWTSGRPTIERSAAAPAAQHASEVYQHGFDQHLSTREDHGVVRTLVDMAIRAAMPFGMPPGLEHVVHDLPGLVLGAFTSSDLEHQVSVRHERQRRDALTCTGVGAVTDFSPGCVFELVGHPVPNLDGKYLLTRVTHSSTPNAAPPASEVADEASHNYESVFECLPVTTSWRPDRRARKPRIYGVQTARVTGPVGMDVYTDSFGRIKVRFPWDRAPDDISGHYTCWLRVSQTWAGQGAPGFVFIPRVGMEVIVSFVDGDPDRPLVTGCVYNGANPTPGMLPMQATKSIIRTRTVPHGPGHNELSFEDAMGMERVHIRAERDLDELVLHDHVTEVRHDQHNLVAGDQVERVGRHQRARVMGKREIQVEGKVTEHSGNDYLRSVRGSGTEQYGGSYELSVEGGSAIIDVASGEYVASAKGSIGFIQNRERMIKLASEGDEAGILLNSRGAVVHISENRILLKVGRSSITIEDGRIQVNRKTYPA